MRSALRTFTSALGVCAACYLLSTASWQQVLLLFMVASFGWTWFAFSSGFEADGAQLSPRKKHLRDLLMEEPLPAVREALAQSAASGQQLEPKVQPAQRVQRVYRFPIHELSRSGLTPATE